MDAKLKADWVNALRSGEYKQTRETLYDGAGYCCLGVLCKVAGLEIRKDGGGVGNESYANSFASYRPIFDLVGGYEASHQLSMRNDGYENFHKHDFSEIADYIEANIPANSAAR